MIKEIINLYAPLIGALFFLITIVSTATTGNFLALVLGMCVLLFSLVIMMLTRNKEEEKKE